MDTESKHEVGADSHGIREDASSLGVGEVTASKTAFSEAVALHGNVQAVEELGYVQRGQVPPVLQPLSQS
jgi:hypothetical protein